MYVLPLGSTSVETGSSLQLLNFGLCLTVSLSVIDSFFSVAGQPSGNPSAHHSQNPPGNFVSLRYLAYAARARSPRQAVLPQAAARGLATKHERSG